MEPWLDPVYDAAEMAAADRWAIEQAGIPSLELMEPAGRGLARAAADLAAGGPITVVCGKGNNGGDGLVAARHLLESGFRVRVVLLWPGDELSPDAQANLKLLPEDASQLAPELSSSALEGIVIDAMLGTGFAGEPRDPVKGAIEAINASDLPVVACDVPSGVDASTGEASGAAIETTRTVTFHGRKLGHLIAPGKHLCGEVEVVPIGIPEEAPSPKAGAVIGPGVLSLLPRRESASNKFTSGRVSIVGGSPGLTGAVCLAAEASIRAGAGYATAAVPGGLEDIFEAKLTEVMTKGIGEGRTFGSDQPQEVLSHLEGAAAVVLGSGIGRTKGAGALARELAAAVTAPLVIDADGLGAIANDPSSLNFRYGKTVITPHVGEAGRLLGKSSSEVQAHRLASARELVSRTRAVVVLKGDDTIVTDGTRVAINTMPAPALATAGTGDVLAGVVGAFLARGLDSFEAAAAAVFAHAVAGHIAGSEVGNPDGVIASDVIRAIPRAMAPME
ncbi:MAG: NAD(P)H-hydrate dehydratase [Solirubrobacterales bacterium]|nr:NAD(P)H-hydrate dehydratase [Solirubrobacterales bacterium]